MIQDFSSRISGFKTAIDLGAGIGRIAKTTLLPVFEEVDLVEPAAAQIERAKENVPNIRKFYQVGLQDFKFERPYDCIWLQWCAMYLTDADLLDFLIRSRDNLEVSEEVMDSGARKSGLLFVKENVNSDRFLVDREDNSIMRTDKHF